LPDTAAAEGTARGIPHDGTHPSARRRRSAAADGTYVGRATWSGPVADALAESDSPGREPRVLGRPVGSVHTRSFANPLHRGTPQERDRCRPACVLCVYRRDGCLGGIRQHAQKYVLVTKLANELVKAAAAKLLTAPIARTAAPIFSVSARIELLLPDRAPKEVGGGAIIVRCHRLEVPDGNTGGAPA
jgi:hypothetical protein